MLLLRKIRKPKWYKNPEIEWLKEGELQADALGDLGTKNNILSMYEIQEDRSNLESVVTALAVNCDSIANFDYALLNCKYVSNLGIEVQSTKGGTPDKTVNSSHYDLIELTAPRLMKLAETIQTSAERGRVREKTVLKLIVATVQQGTINLGDLKCPLKKKIRDSLANC